MPKTKTERAGRIRWVSAGPSSQFIANGLIRRHDGIPAALVRHAGLATLDLVPRCCTPEADTMCDCGGLLAQVAGVWRHLDLCPACNGRSGSCDRQHIGCTRPAPRQCQQRRCSAPVTVADSDSDPRVCGDCSRGRLTA
jgi:hypothetical protein